MSKVQPDNLDVITDMTVINNATDKERVLTAKDKHQLAFRYNDQNLLIVNEYPDNDDTNWIAIGRFLNHSVVNINFRKIPNPNAKKPITK